MSGLRILRGCLGILLLPISIYYSFRLLSEIHASELLWFLFWILFPFWIGFGIIDAILKAIDKEEYK